MHMNTTTIDLDALVIEEGKEVLKKIGADNRISYERVTCPIDRLYKRSLIEKRASEYHQQVEKKEGAV